MSLARTFYCSEQVTWSNDISGSEKHVENGMHSITTQF